MTAPNTSAQRAAEDAHAHSPENRRETAITRLIDAEQIARIRREEREARALAGQITAQFRAGGAR